MRLWTASLLPFVFFLPASLARAAVIDDFESGSLSNWVSPCGGWTVTSPGRNSNFAVELTGTQCCGASADHMLTHASFMASYGRYSFDLFFSMAGLADGDLIFQVSGCSAIQCIFGPSGGDNSADVASLVTGTSATGLACTPVHMVAGTWHSIAIERYANGVIRVFTDGVLRMEGLETSLTAAGGIVLGGHSTGVRFDNIAFDPSLPPAPTPAGPGSCSPLGPRAGCSPFATVPPPTQPAGVSATQGERCRVLVSWQDVSGESGYRVYRNGTLVGTVAADVVQFSDMVPAGPYTYCVASFGCSESSRSCAEGSSGAPPAFYSASGNYYEPVSAPLNWTGAKLAAESYSFLSASGHLATIATSGENTFVAQLGGADRWLGGYQADTSNEPAGGWVWVTGEPFSFTSWASGEPNNDLIGGEHESYLEMKDSGGGWNDVVQWDPNIGFVVEYDTGMPLAPRGGFAASDGGTGHVTTVWSPAAAASRYHLYRDGELIASLPSTAAGYTDFTAAGTYSYCVRSANACGSESEPACDEGTSLPGPPPPPPFSSPLPVMPEPCWRDGEPCAMVTFARGRTTGGALRMLPRSALSEAPELEIDLERSGFVRLDLFDLLGRRVATLLEGELPAGITRLRWDGRDRSGGFARRGVYLARLTVLGGEHAAAIVLGP